jgi:hypothetical protein
MNQRVFIAVISGILLSTITAAGKSMVDVERLKIRFDNAMDSILDLKKEVRDSNKEIREDLKEIKGYLLRNKER